MGRKPRNIKSTAPDRAAASSAPAPSAAAAAGAGAAAEAPPAATNSRTLDGFREPEKQSAEDLIQRGLQEDLPAGDITSEAIIPQGVAVQASLSARQDGILCGLPVVALLFKQIEPALSLRPLRSDGDKIHAGAPFLEISGPVQPILRGERLALNFLQRLSGIATLTHQFADAIAGTGCLLYDTRKTTPGWRILEKYAVRIGGGRNHRLNLSEFALIKDNHRQVLAALGNKDMKRWVDQLRRRSPGCLVELEVDTLEELEQALEAQPDIILADNFTLPQLQEAARMVQGRAGKQPLLEASGGIGLHNIRDIAAAGIQRISVGKLTHSAIALDIGLDVDQVIG